MQKVCSANNDVTVAGIPREEGETHSDAFSCKGKLGPHCDGCYILRVSFFSYCKILQILEKDEQGNLNSKIRFVQIQNSKPSTAYQMQS